MKGDDAEISENLNELKTKANFAVHIRPADTNDREFILSLLPRLIEFEIPPWRDKRTMLAADSKVLNNKITDKPPGTAIFIAEDDKGAALGFIHLQAGKDYYNRDEHGHIADVIVASEGEGRGVGRALIEKGEQWARTQGFRWLTLNVFAQNLHAREVYKRLGYGEDLMKYVKKLD